MNYTVNGCSYTEPWVIPANWETTTAKSALAKNWFVQVQFYDPRFKDKYPNGFQMRRKLNRFKTLEARRQAALVLIKSIPKLLSEEYWNPITREYMSPPEEEGEEEEVSGNMPLTKALQLALDVSNYEDDTRKDVKSILKYFNAAADNLNYGQRPVSEIKTIHADKILNEVRVNKKPLSDKRYNKYLAYLSKLFKTLRKKGIIEHMVMDEPEKRKVLVEPRRVLTPAERIKINDFLKSNYPSFWLFSILFFHSGGREVELLSLKYEDIDILNLKYKTLVKKGGRLRMIYRPIKKIAVPYWEMALRGAQNGDYIFSVGLQPGKHRIRREQITRRWNVHVKKKLEIKADFYSLKHSNLTEISTKKGTRAAAGAAGHTTTKMIEKHYDVEFAEREMDAVRNMTNDFIPAIPKLSGQNCNPASSDFFHKLPATGIQMFRSQPQKGQGAVRSSEGI